VKILAREAVGDEDNPYWQAKAIHDFVVEKVRFGRLDADKGAGTSALLSTAALDEETGELYYEGACDKQAALFVAMARAVGLPARAVTGMVGWGPWVDKEDLELRNLRHTKLSRDGLAAARLFGPLGGHRWGEFYLPNYGWIPVDPTWDRFAWVGNQRVIFSKGTDVLIGPDAPPGGGGGYGDQWIPLQDGRINTIGWGVWNLARVRVANVKVVHYSDPFPADAFAGYPVDSATDGSSTRAPIFDGREALRLIDDFTRRTSDKQSALAEAYEKKPRLQESQEQFIIHMLREVVGNEAFFEISQNYEKLRTRSGESVPTRRFREIAEEVHGESLDWFFSQWLESGELPQVKLENVETAQTGDGWQIRGYLRQLNERVFRLPVGLEITTEGEKRIEHVWVDARETTFESNTLDIPKSIIVDPNFDLLKIQKMPPVLSDLWNTYPNLLVVYGTLAEAQANKAAAERINRKYLELDDQAVKADVDVNEEDLSTQTLILFGRPETNLTAQRFAQDFAIQFEDDRFTYGGMTYDRVTQGVAQVVENPRNPGGLIIMCAGLSGEATKKVCDMSEWREETGGRPLVGLNASFVVLDGYQILASGDWERFDDDLVRTFADSVEN
jgi:transglutaminase-like putative cysteine protease